MICWTCCQVILHLFFCLRSLSKGLTISRFQFWSWFQGFVCWFFTPEKNIKDGKNDDPSRFATLCLKGKSQLQNLQVKNLDLFEVIFCFVSWRMIIKPPSGRILIEILSGTSNQIDQHVHRFLQKAVFSMFPSYPLSQILEIVVWGDVVALKTIVHHKLGHTFYYVPTIYTRRIHIWNICIHLPNWNQPKVDKFVSYMEPVISRW